MLGIVFVHYRIPDRRLREHFAWNALRYRQFGAKVFVVANRNYLNDKRESDRWAVCLIYSEPMPVFSLSATKNFGIMAAIEAGCDRIATTDTDIAWTPDALRQCVACNPKEAIAPIYRMAQTYDTREQVSHPDHGCAGTVCLTADNWRKVRYDERYVGYGGEDGRLRRDIAAAGIAENRTAVVYHIAHNPEAEQVNIPGAGRGDCWNRNSINPDNWQVNKHLIDR